LGAAALTRVWSRESRSPPSRSRRTPPRRSHTRTDPVRRHPEVASRPARSRLRPHAGAEPVPSAWRTRG
jgi:hypothetical protein